MLEIEIKAKVPAHAHLIGRLRQEGFVLADTLLESDTYFNGGGRDFAKTDEALRLRSTENEVAGTRKEAITYKGPKLDQFSKMRREYEVGISDAPLMRELLCALGYAPVFTVKKRRAYYTRGEVSACVDTVEGLGTYVELEIIAEESGQSERAVEELFALLEELGVPRESCTRKSYLELLLEQSVVK